MTELQMFVRNQVRLRGKGFAGPKLVCIDLQPYTTTQAPERSNILNVGGFSDAVFSVVAAFLADDSGRFVAKVEKVELKLKTPPVQIIWIGGVYLDRDRIRQRGHRDSLHTDALLQ